MSKRFLATFLAACMMVVLGGCGSSSADAGETTDTTADAETPGATEATEAPAETTTTDSETTEPVELTVFAAASMTETLTSLGDAYMKENPDVSLTFNFDSSGTLKTQIQEEADCDLFISAGQKQMDELDANADPTVNTEGLDFVSEETRMDILENKVTLCVPEENSKNINNFQDMATALENGSILMAMGNSDVPVGQYTQKILAFYNLDEAALAESGVISYGTNVKEVATQIKEGSVDCGVIYCTDAYSEGLKIVDNATEEMCGKVIYPAAVLKNSKNADASKAFLDYLTTDEAMSVFEEVGFSPVA